MNCQAADGPSYLQHSSTEDSFHSVPEVLGNNGLPFITFFMVPGFTLYFSLLYKSYLEVNFLFSKGATFLFFANFVGL